MTIWLVSLSYAQTLPPTLIVSNMTYNAAGQVTQVNFGNGDVTTYTYNDLNLRLTQLKTVKTGGTVVQDLNYTYDAVGNILSITDNVGQADQTFQYDHLNRLTQAVGQNYGTKTYSYDVLGNITQKDGLTYTYDGIAGGPHAVTSLSDGTTFTYDANGNMATQQKGSDLKVFIYDAENRLIEVKLNGTTVESYEYDGDGGRTKKLPNSSTPNTKFIGQMYEEQGTRKTSYIFLGDQRIAAVTNGAILYFHGDHLGSANIVSDSTGVIKELSEYEPYGQFSRHEKYGTPEEQAYFYFTNQYLDETTSLYYYGARYYHPLIGRFITADSIVQAPGDPQTFNRYSYTGNNPINRTDPSGHSWSNFFKSFIGAFIGAIATVVLGPIGLGVFSTWAAAGAVGGALGGAISGGLSGGWQGMLIGAATGGALGALGGYAYGLDSLAGNLILGGMAIAGVGYTASTGSWDSFAGGVLGGFAGGAVGNGIVGSKSFQNWKAGRTNAESNLVLASEAPRSTGNINNPNQNPLNVSEMELYVCDPILQDGNVQTNMVRAWKESFSPTREQGGWIYKNSEGGFGVSRWPAGAANGYNDLPSAPVGTVGMFHTHPGNVLHAPSAADYFTTNVIYGGVGYQKYSSYIIDSQSIMRIQLDGFSDVGRLR